jgi:hypothetical protein
MLKRAYGTEISGNRGPNDELLSKQRAGILRDVENQKPKKQIAHEWRVNRSTVYDTIHR